MSFALDVERLSEILEDVEKTIYAFHKWRNVTSEDDYLETEDTPLGSIIESLMDLESSMDMENDDEADPTVQASD